MQVRILPVIKLSVVYDSTRAQIRTIFGGLSSASSRSQETTDYYNDKFKKRTSGNKHILLNSDSCELFCGSSSISALSEMPVVAAAVAAHRRVIPAAGSLAGSTAASSKRSSCVTRLSVPTSSNNTGASPKKPCSGNVKFTGVYGGGGGMIVNRPLTEIKQFLQVGPVMSRAAILADCKRYYAKGKDKQKGKKSSVQVNENEMAEVIDVEKFKKQQEKLIAQMKDDFTKQLSIRGASGALESLEVEFEGEKYPLQELAQVGRKNPQLAILNLASLPDAIKPVLKAIEDSGMNLNPQQEGTTIYVPLPKVTREHRETLAKNAKALFTKYKVAMQAVQNKYVKDCRSQKDLSEDLLYSVQQQIMKYTENVIHEAEKLTELKQKELLDTK